MHAIIDHLPTGCVFSFLWNLLLTYFFFLYSSATPLFSPHHHPTAVRACTSVAVAMPTPPTCRRHALPSPFHTCRHPPASSPCCVDTLLRCCSAVSTPPRIITLPCQHPPASSPSHVNTQPCRHPPTSSPSRVGTLPHRHPAVSTPSHVVAPPRQHPPASSACHPTYFAVTVPFHAATVCAHPWPPPPSALSPRACPPMATASFRAPTMCAHPRPPPPCVEQRCYMRSHADVNARDKDGWMPLLCASVVCHLFVIKVS